MRIAVAAGASQMGHSRDSGARGSRRSTQQPLHAHACSGARTDGGAGKHHLICSRIDVVRCQRSKHTQCQASTRNTPSSPAPPRAARQRQNIKLRIYICYIC
jgi:hypothetical protein